MLKPLHEVGIIKDGNRVDSYIYSEGSVQDVKTQPWVIASADQFKVLVANNQVQFLQYDKGQDRIVAKYTDEELQWLKQTNPKVYKYTSNSNTDDYFKDDVVFKKQHIALAEQEKALAVSAGPIVSLLGVKIITLVMYGSNNMFNRFVADITLEYHLEQNKLGNFASSNKINGHSFMLPYNFISNDTIAERFLYLAKKNMLLFDTYPLRNNDLFKQAKKLFMQGNIKENIIQRTCDIFENITKNNENRI